MSGPSKELLVRRDKLKDICIAALEAEIERLKCCGNCGHFETRIDLTEVTILRGCELDEIEVDPRGCCPSRWVERSKP